MENSNISWTTHTFNPWRGCTKVSEGCKHCYAEFQEDTRFHRVHWGPGQTRVISSDAAWAQPPKWNRDAARTGTRPRVFCASLADVMDDEAPADARARLWEMIRDTPNLDWLLLSKRPQNYSKYLPWKMDENPWPNVWLGTTTENKLRANERIPIIREIPAVVRFLSAEPLLSDFDDVDLSGIQWVIIGGESGHQARRMDLDWVRRLIERCRRYGVHIWVKQMGQVWAKENKKLVQIYTPHGRILSEWPQEFRIQELPLRPPA